MLSETLTVPNGDATTLLIQKKQVVSEMKNDLSLVYMHAQLFCQAQRVRSNLGLRVIRYFSPTHCPKLDTF